MATRDTITRSFSWNTLAVVLQVAIQVIYTAILARLIAPADFALMGIVLSLMGFAEIFSQVGIGPALIQRRDLQSGHLSAAFYTALILGILFTSAFLLGAPSLARLYDLPELEPVIRVVSTSFVISALGVVPRSMMIRELEMRRFFFAGMISIVGGNLLVGLYLAASGWGVWAYVWALFAQNLLMTLAYWLFRPVRIPLGWNGRSTRELIRYGTGSTLFNSLNYAATKVDVALTPLFASRMPGISFPEQMRLAGLYERSAYVVSLPITIMAKLSDNVMFAGMSAMQEDTGRLKRAVKTASHFLSVCITPAVIFAICFAPELLRIYLGPEYSDAAPILRILLGSVVLRSLSRISDSLLRARDATFQGSAVKAVYLALMIIGVASFTSEGMTAVAWAILAATGAHYIMSAFLCARLVGMPALSQVGAALPGIFLGAVVALTSLGILAWGHAREAGPLFLLLCGAAGSAVSSALALWWWPALLGRGEESLLRFLPARLRNWHVFSHMLRRT